MPRLSYRKAPAAGGMKGVRRDDEAGGTEGKTFATAGVILKTGAKRRAREPG